MLSCPCGSAPAYAHSDDGHGNWTWYCPCHYVDNVNSGCGDSLRANNKPTGRLGSAGLPPKKGTPLLHVRLATCYGKKPVQKPLRRVYPGSRGLQ